MRRTQSSIFTETPDDMPLFSRTAYGPTPEAFTPTVEAQQDSFLDRRQYIALPVKPKKYKRQTIPSDGWMDGGEPYTEEEMEIIRAEEEEEE